MHQPFLDLTNYSKPTDPSQYNCMQDFLCNAPKTDGRFGFGVGSRFSDSGFVQSFLTPHGLQVKEGHFITLLSVFGVFNFEVLRRLCESPLPDASVINLVDNAVRIMQEDTPGEPIQFTLTQVGYINCYDRKSSWTSCGCDCLIEWDGRCMMVSLEVASMLETTGRLKVIPIAERMCPRHGCMHELKYYPHPNPVDWLGKPITQEMIDADVARYRTRNN